MGLPELPLPRRRTLAGELPWIGLVVLVTFVALWPVVMNGFVQWDDYQHLVLNPRMNPPSLATTISFWRRPFFGMYIPVTYTIWSGLAAIARSPRGALLPDVFHTINLLLHAAVASVVYLLLRRFIRLRWAAAIGALLFAVHPLQVESVAWVSAMRDLLCGLFSFLAIEFYLGFASLDENRSPRSKYAIATFLFILALLSKPSAVVVPFIAFTIDAGLLRRPWRKPALALLPWLIVAVIIVQVARAAQPMTPTTPLWSRPIVALDSLGFYLHKLVIPVTLVLDYGRTPQRVLDSHSTWISVVIAILFLVTLVLCRRRWPVLAVAGGIFILGLLPVLGLVSFSFQEHSTVADHYVYVSFFGAALAFAWAMQRIDSRIAMAAGVAVVLILASLSFRQTWFWKDTFTVMTHELDGNPRSTVAHTNLTVEYLNRHNGPAALKHALAAEKYSARDNLDIRMNLGLAYAMSHRLSDAERELRRAVEIAPRDVAARICLGDVLAERGERSAAESQLLEAQRLAPDNPIVTQRLNALRAKPPPATTQSGT